MSRLGCDYNTTSITLYYPIFVVIVILWVGHSVWTCNAKNGSKPLHNMFRLGCDYDKMISPYLYVSKLYLSASRVN